MAEKTLNSRIILKHDTEANWLKATNFKPIAGEVIIYDVDENYSYPRIKIGDGNTLINELPFAATRPDWNAVEGEEGYIGNKPNVVKSVNGVVPDESGNVQTPQSDWDETNETSPAFIKNKPEAATDEEIIDMMLSIDMMPVMQDADGSILVDSDEAILMI